MPERPDDDDAQVLLLTYAELGERLGVSPDGARMRAKRKTEAGEWRMVAPNSRGGAVRVRLPAGDLPEHAPERSPERRGNIPDDPSILVERVDGLEADIVGLRATIARELRAWAELTDGLAAERTRAAVTEARLEAEREAAEDRVAARNAVIEELRAELARLRLPFWRRWIG